MFFLDDDFLCIGDDDIEFGIIQYRQNRRVVHIMECDILVQNMNIFRRNDFRLVKRLDFQQGAEHRLVRREYKRIVAETLVFRIFVGQQELIEDAGGHENRLAKPHGQRIDIVRVSLLVLLHLLKQCVQNWF